MNVDLDDVARRLRLDDFVVDMLSVIQCIEAWPGISSALVGSENGQR